MSHKDLANAIRFLAIDAVEAAGSGHPGMPMGMADIAVVLFKQVMKFDPANPTWVNRDRLVVSNGHGSMLLYAALHLAGYPISIDNIKQFRQLGSPCCGHPELDQSLGIETTTGPLGQGFANAVGLAIASKMAGAEFESQQNPLIDYHVFALVGDGCMMEGVASEAASLAGTLELSALTVLWDDNGISIDGETQGWFTESVPQRFEAYGWNVKKIDGHDPEAIAEALAWAKTTQGPTLIACKTHIGYGSKVQDTAKAHGSPLGSEGVQAVRHKLKWTHQPFVIPESIYAAWSCQDKGRQYYQEWHERWEQFRQQKPGLAQELERRGRGEEHLDWNKLKQRCLLAIQDEPQWATRQCSNWVIDQWHDLLPEWVGGSADLTGSNLTQSKAVSVFTAKNSKGRYLHYGVREFAMMAIANGLSLSGLFRPFCGTFLTFSDYGRNAIRMAAMMKLPVTYVLTHDSIGLGEDGPTHQPIEHVSSLRLIPDLDVWRPADLAETWVAWQSAIQRTGATALALSRQGLPTLSKAPDFDAISRGAYVVWESSPRFDCMILATGSEVHLGVEVAKKLCREDFHVRVVSMPCWESFKRQPQPYRQHVLPEGVSFRVAIEAGSSGLWHEWVGSKGMIFALDDYGCSAPASKVYQFFGLTVNEIFSKIRDKSVNFQK
ncbi:MAG TPA: transketolase [Gammaproteobacteria bacterium]|nr:transketolase [Gammaproteobacteria bacterium]